MDLIEGRAGKYYDGDTDTPATFEHFQTAMENHAAWHSVLEYKAEMIAQEMLRDSTKYRSPSIKTIRFTAETVYFTQTHNNSCSCHPDYETEEYEFPARWLFTDWHQVMQSQRDEKDRLAAIAAATKDAADAEKRRLKAIKDAAEQEERDRREFDRLKQKFQGVTNA